MHCLEAGGCRAGRRGATWCGEFQSPKAMDSWEENFRGAGCALDLEGSQANGAEVGDKRGPSLGSHQANACHLHTQHQGLLWADNSRLPWRSPGDFQSEARTQQFHHQIARCQG